MVERSRRVRTSVPWRGTVYPERCRKSLTYTSVKTALTRKNKLKEACTACEICKYPSKVITIFTVLPPSVPSTTLQVRGRISPQPSIPLLLTKFIRRHHLIRESSRCMFRRADGEKDGGVFVCCASWQWICCLEATLSFTHTFWCASLLVVPTHLAFSAVVLA